jgi:predicted metal-dependent peptidase
MSYKEMPPHERITVLHIDLMRDPEFSRLGAVTQVGRSMPSNKVPTACTNGLDTYYSADWLMRMSREQARYVVAHENLHKMLQHCTAYIDVCTKYPDESGLAMDFVVNQLIEDMDNGRGFVARPTDVPPQIDPKYKGWSWLEVLQDILKNSQPQEGCKGKGKGNGGFDKHEQAQAGDGGDDGEEGDEADADDGTPGKLTQAEVKDLQKLMQDAAVQGEIVSKRLRGKGSSGMSLSGYMERDTDWRTPMLQFLQENCEGDDLSRWCPPSRRFLPLDIIMPSHYTEAAGELVVACDTSGSMQPYYALIFGEIGRFCQMVTPSKLHVIWWDDSVQAVQTFTAADYGRIKDLLKPKGCGGTTVSCVAQYMRKHSIKPQATIYLTDGEIEAQYEVATGPVLWGVVGNPNFVPLRGKLVNIKEVV